MRIKKRIRASIGDRAFYIVCMVFIIILLTSVIYPIVYILSSSFSDGRAVTGGQVRLLPVDFSLEGYKAVFRDHGIGKAYYNTVLYTVLGTAINLALCLICAYPLSRRDLPGRGWMMLLFTFTMYFSGGMIPAYLLMRDLYIIDTIWVMVLPGALNVYNMILMRTFIQSSIPNELLEATTIDGCNDTQYFLYIVLPLSNAIFAVVALYSAVGHWNAYFNAMIYLNSADRMPLQIKLREILVSNKIEGSMLADPELEAIQSQLNDVIKYALIVVSTAPIMCIYPFIQKYFVQGVMIGSIKG